VYPSAAFYDGRLRDGVTSQQRVSGLPLGQPWDGPLTFLHSATPEFRTAASSFSNAGEADVMLQLLGILLDGGVSGKDVAVITPYDAQRQLLRGRISARHGAIGIDVDSVDAFQGRESNFVVVSMVRSNSQRKVGFFDKDTRLNVAITRARYCLVIVGNQDTLRSASNLSSYLANLASRRLIYTMDAALKLTRMTVTVQAAGLATRDESGALLGSLERPVNPTWEASMPDDPVVFTAEARTERKLEGLAPLVSSRRECERPVAAAASIASAHIARKSCRLSASCATLAHPPTATAGTGLRGAQPALTLWCPAHSSRRRSCSRRTLLPFHGAFRPAASGDTDSSDASFGGGSRGSSDIWTRARR
jgi:hypothetical protein